MKLGGDPDAVFFGGYADTLGGAPVPDYADADETDAPNSPDVTQTTSSATGRPRQALDWAPFLVSFATVAALVCFGLGVGLLPQGRPTAVANPIEVHYWEVTPHPEQPSRVLIDVVPGRGCDAAECEEPSLALIRILANPETSWFAAIYDGDLDLNWVTFSDDQFLKARGLDRSDLKFLKPTTNVKVGWSTVAGERRSLGLFGTAEGEGLFASLFTVAAFTSRPIAVTKDGYVAARLPTYNTFSQSFSSPDLLPHTLNDTPCEQLGTYSFSTKTKEQFAMCSTQLWR